MADCGIGWTCFLILASLFFFFGSSRHAILRMNVLICSNATPHSISPEHTPLIPCLCAQTQHRYTTSDHQVQDFVGNMDLPFSGQWGDAELFGPSTVLYPSTRPQARDTSRTNSLQLYQSSTSAHLHNLPPTPEDSELHFFNLFPEVSDAMPELPWHSEPPALRMVHTMDFDNLPAAPVAAEQFRMMPGVVCPSETQFGDAMHPQRYAELLACHNPDPQGCALSDTSSNLDYSNVESTAPLLEQSPARSERMPSMDYFAEQGPPAYNHAPQPFRPTVSTDMPPPRPTRSLSVGPHVTEPVSARGVRASSLPIDHIYVPPNLFNRADVNCWLVEQAQAPELHSFHEVRWVLQVSVLFLKCKGASQQSWVRQVKKTLADILNSVQVTHCMFIHQGNACSLPGFQGSSDK